MPLLNPQERRRSPRHVINRMAKIKVSLDSPPRDCLVTDISDGGVRLHVEGIEVPDDFVLLLSGEGVAGKERIYKVAWRLGYEIGAEFVSFVRRSEFGGRI